MNQTWENGKKPSFRPHTRPLGPNLGHQILFLKNLSSSVTRYYGQLSLSACTISENNNDSWACGQTNGPTDNQMRVIS